MITEENKSKSGFAVQHYSVTQVAEMWGLSDDAVRRLFENEPGVLVLGDVTKPRRRHHRTMRIPAFVLERVHKKLSRV